MARVSFSQYSMWSSCPHQYKLAYIDGLRESSSSIHTVFGSAMHETLQEYLSRCLRISKSQADKNMNTKEFLKEKMRESFLKESNEGQNPICSKEELVEFLEDGYLILDYFQKSKNFNNFLVGQGNYIAYINVAGSAGAFSISTLGANHSNTGTE